VGPILRNNQCVLRAHDAKVVEKQTIRSTEMIRDNNWELWRTHASCTRQLRVRDQLNGFSQRRQDAWSKLYRGKGSKLLLIRIRLV
jgi:hypothetical protein